MNNLRSAVAFPPGPHGVLLPRNDRSCAARGLTLYTASKPIPLAIQWAAWAWIRTIGPHRFPGRNESIDIPYLEEISAGLGDGVLDSVALYRRRDAVRSGATFIACGRTTTPLLIKVRSDHDQLAREQQILAKLATVGSLSFRTPKPLGIGKLRDGRTWAAQEMVFTAPHFPCTDLNSRFVSDLTRALQVALPHAPVEHPDWRPAHGDLTPWNLRRDHRGRMWLFDWEDAGYAPPGADNVYFHAALGLVRPRRDMPIAGDAAARFWIDRVEARLAAGHPEQNNIILERLRSAVTGSPL